MNNNHQSTLLEELDSCNFVIPNDWLSKFETYDLDTYSLDIKTYGTKTTWEYICKFVLTRNNTVDLLDISNFGELYETALEIIDKQQKKDNGQYFTPDDVALVMSNWFKNLDASNVCDVACGTGKLILTYLELIGETEAKSLLKNNRIYLYDIDDIALAICKTSIVKKYGLKYLKNINIINCDFLDNCVHLPADCKVISNPPYSKIPSIPDTWNNTKIQQETKELYASFMEKIISESDKSVIISPYSFIGGSKFYSLRTLLNASTGFIVSFDNVPGNIFYGKKHGIFRNTRIFL